MDPPFTIEAMQALLRIQTFFTALPLAFGLLHLFLFAAQPRLRSNLYYGLFLVFVAAAIFFDFQEMMTEGGALDMLLVRLQRAAVAFTFAFGLRFFYEVFLDGRAPQYPYLAVGYGVTGLLAVVAPARLSWPLWILILVGLVEIGRVVTGGVRRRREDARLIAAGFVVFTGFVVYDLLLDFGLFDPFRGMENAYQYGIAGLVVATSAYLARSIARTNRQLVEQERLARERELERRLLEAEVERTSAELEEARRLQLSMLPAEVPERPGLKVAVHMETAAEVGGDYYDFREGPDGVLTVAVGDATGHGLRAGHMVAVAKSLFHGLREDEDLTDFFDRCTRVIKPMRLGNLFMALTLVRVKRGVLTVAAAGMPPLLVYRAGDGVVDEVILKGMPLGAFPGFPYRQACLSVGSGDAFLLMTDGLPELFDAEREMLGWERVKDAFREVGDRTPEEIVAHLHSVGEVWRDGCRQEDDVTLVVLKTTPEAP